MRFCLVIFKKKVRYIFGVNHLVHTNCQIQKTFHDENPLKIFSEVIEYVIYFYTPQKTQRIHFFFCIFIHHTHHLCIYTRLNTVQNIAQSIHKQKKKLIKFIQVNRQKLQKIDFQVLILSLFAHAMFCVNFFFYFFVDFILWGF